MTVELKPHQQEAVDKLANGKILYGGTGVGKTITSLAYFYTKVCKGVLNDFGSMRTPKDLYIITTAKVRNDKDWEITAAKFGLYNGGVENIAVTVDSWNNIAKYRDVKDAFFIFDEQRVVGSGAWTKAFEKITKSNEWILLTATPGDTWLDYIPVFVANGFYKNRTEFKKTHVVYNHYGKFPKVDRYIATGRLVRHRNNILVHMPYERHTKRHVKDVVVDHNQELFNRVVKDRWHVFEERPLRDVAEMFIVMRKVVNTDASRLDTLREMLRKHPKVIVFYNFDYELEMLRTLAVDLQEISNPKVSELSPSSMTSFGPAGNPGESKSETGGELGRLQSWSIREWNGHKHHPVPTTDRWIYLVQYTAGAEGWNCITTDTVVFYSLTYSWKAFWQAQGRIDRMNTPFTDLWYYVLTSKSMIDKAIKRSLNAKKSFNEKSFVSEVTDLAF